ncbi:MAG: hypothetical protein JW718_07585 [Desulfovibrionaceae bacterium]|nr:hypothetical protein [Desulfovibrionaceae bacterium]
MDTTAKGRAPGVVRARGLRNWFGDGSDGEVVISADTSLALTLDGDMVVKNYESLTIDEGKTLSVQNRCKGLLVYVRGDCAINGTLSMTARGAHADPVAAGVSEAGLLFRRFKSGETESNAETDLLSGAGADAVAAENNQPQVSGNGKVYAITRAGAAKGSGVVNSSGGNGGAGTSGQSGGGGAGGGGPSVRGGHGADGSCFSGGPGGSGGWTATGDDADPNGGPGGGGDFGGNSGGAGNPGGAGEGHGESGDDGTGGLIVLIVGGDLTIGANGKIESNGADGGDGVSADCTAGGASGGGPILVLYAGDLSNSGTIQSNGGSGGTGVGQGKIGGNGGAGSIQGPTQIAA